MATKLTNKDLDNVAGGACGNPPKCSECDLSLEDVEYWTVNYSINLNRSNKQSYKLCKTCKEKHKDDPHYWDWKKVLG